MKSRAWSAVIGLGTAVALAAIVAGVHTAVAVEPERILAERGAKAPLVVVGEPLGQSSRWEDGGIWTYTELAVRRRLGLPSEETIVVRQRGGTVGRIAQRVTHLRLVDPTRPHLLLLWKDPQTDLWSPLPEGVLPIDLGLDGEERVFGVRLASVLSLLESLR